LVVTVPSRLVPGCFLGGDTFVHDAQAVLGTGGHGQREGLAVHTEAAQVAITTNLGDFDSVGSEEVCDFLIAGVAAHGSGGGLAEMSQHDPGDNPGNKPHISAPFRAFYCTSSFLYPTN
jgi:hypothetical protein